MRQPSHSEQAMTWQLSIWQIAFWKLYLCGNWLTDGWEELVPCWAINVFSSLWRKETQVWVTRAKNNSGGSNTDTRHEQGRDTDTKHEMDKARLHRPQKDLVYCIHITTRKEAVNWICNNSITSPNMYIYYRKLYMDTKVTPQHSSTNMLQYGYSAF